MNKRVTFPQKEKMNVSGNGKAQPGMYESLNKKPNDKSNNEIYTSLYNMKKG